MKHKSGYFSFTSIVQIATAQYCAILRNNVQFLHIKKYLGNRDKTQKSEFVSLRISWVTTGPNFRFIV